jgi:hypothetical protein
VLVIAVFVTIWAGFTIAWVEWNRSIYRRRHRRTTPLDLDVEMHEDSLGRSVLGAAAAQTSAGQIFISVDREGLKHYSRAPREQASDG